MDQKHDEKPERLRIVRTGEPDPVLPVIGICADGKLSQNYEEELYGDSPA